MHSTTEDNEAGIATGWLPGRLSAQGRELAADLADGRRRAAVDAVFTSDLNRALETVELTFGRDPVVPVLHDWRLRECDFGDLNGADVALVHAERLRFLDEPYPAGESWRQAIDRVGRFIADLSTRWGGAGHGDGVRSCILAVRLPAPPPGSTDRGHPRARHPVARRLGRVELHRSVAA